MTADSDAQQRDPGTPEPPANDSPVAVAAAAVATAMGAGLCGMLLALLLHAIQHVAYGYSLGQLTGAESFMTAVSDASGERRVIVLIVGGLVAGLGWAAVHRFGRPLVSVQRAMAAPAPSMPVGATIAHALLQIVTVALGSPLGREVAPREVGALIGERFAILAGISPEHRRWIVACGAGAGLAAVYNVPLGGAIFVLEVLLVSFAWQAVVLALASATIAATIAWVGLGSEAQYTVPHFEPAANLLAWALIFGPLFGLAGHAFMRLTTAARDAAPRGRLLIVLCVLNFTIIGCLAVYFPQLLGNGKGPAQAGFDGAIAVRLAAILLVLKVAIDVGTLRAGAKGGLMTPGIANGALLGIVLGGIWSLFWPGAPLGAFALIGAGAFLATSMRMPITAIVLIAEFTRVNHDFLVPVVLAVCGSVCASRWMERTRLRAARPSSADIPVAMK